LICTLNVIYANLVSLVIVDELTRWSSRYME